MQEIYYDEKIIYTFYFYPDYTNTKVNYKKYEKKGYWIESRSKKVIKYFYLINTKIILIN